MADNYDLLNPEALAAQTLAQDDGSSDDFWSKVGAARQTAGQAQQDNWFARTPKNIGIGAYKAALSTIEFGSDLADAVVSDAVGQSAVPVKPPPSIREFVPGFFEAAHAFADEATANNTVSDGIVQGVSQFALPFAGYMRAVGALTGIGPLAKVAQIAIAEAITSGTAFDPHDGRMADLLQMGQDAEGKFGDLMRKVAPDGSLTNAYIDYMTNREDEGEWEGRFKNVVDNAAVSAALGGILTAGATGFRVARQAATAPMKVGPASQVGAVGADLSGVGADGLTDIERARALKDTVVTEGGEHVTLEGDTLNQLAEVVTLKPKENK